ncbi:hypothetical protein LJB76_01595 [Clostridia bacterium OttesenSCG-928-O13]|nr:hypothetical protein [Clostridia bacterium OttesenSCG-928-O13]
MKLGGEITRSVPEGTVKSAIGFQKVTTEVCGGFGNTLSDFANEMNFLTLNHYGDPQGMIKAFVTACTEVKTQS